MYFGGFLLRRSGSWATWIAFRSTLTGASAIAAGWIVKATALPALARELNELDTTSAAPAQWAMTLGAWLPFVGVPALLLGIAAIVTRSLRRPLAVLAAIASLAAIAAIVATLIGAMLPLYQQVPRDLNPMAVIGQLSAVGPGHGLPSAPCGAR